MKALFTPDPLRVLPYRVRTNSRATFFRSQVRINRRGFRGKDLATNRGSIFRIVALGESNTFGFTLNPEHKPWPDQLERMIRQRLRPGRPVRVINAGLPHHSLEANLRRMQRDILPLKPDMIISYHGWNGFPWLNSTLPPVFIKHLPSYKPRPLRLLADCEYRLRLLAFKHSLASGTVLEPPSPTELMANRYAAAYRELINVARTNDIHLVLANYSMAVNDASDPAVVEFYRGMFPSVYPSIQVNAFHSLLVGELAQRHPNVTVVDTHPQLDGVHSKFIDLVHFAPEGDLQLAETCFAAITNRLRRELALPLPPG
jgi:lysophospholipase L1-like esterase